MGTAFRTAIVTGGSRGIGAAAVSLLARNGWRVAVGCYQRLERANALCASLAAEGCQVFPFQGDVASAAEMEALVQAVLERWGQLDLFVNNAGIAQQKLFTDLTEEDWDRMFAVNARSLFTCCPTWSAATPGISSTSPPFGGRWGPPARCTILLQRRRSSASPRRWPRSWDPAASG